MTSVPHAPTMPKQLRSLCVFCGSRVGRHPAYAAAAREVGRLLGARGITLVYGGGRVGLMGELADAALQAGAHVIGVIPQMLIEREVGHSGLTELEVVTTLAQRKVRMGELSDAFMALPGGIGTLDELFEVWTWSQLYRDQKPSGLLNVNGYYDPLLTFLDRSVEEDFLRPECRQGLLVASRPDVLLDSLAAVLQS